MDNGDKNMKDGDMIVYNDNGMIKVGKVKADAAWRGGFVVDGRSIANIKDDCFIISVISL
jgi:hypothetical protein